MIKKILLLICALFLISSMCYGQYEWYAEEKLTVSTSVTQLSSEEYEYSYGKTRMTVTADANSVAFTLNEMVTDGTTAANGILISTDDANSPTYLDVQILYNGLDSADFDPNNTLTGGTSGATATLSAAYTRGTADKAFAFSVRPEIAEIHVLDNSIIWTSNDSTPVYSTTDANCFGEKQAEGDTFTLLGKDQITGFKAITSDPNSVSAYIYVRYGK